MIADRIKSSRRYKTIKASYDKYERILIPGMLVVGVIVDFVTFRSIQLKTAFIVLAIYLVITGLTIAFMHFYDELWKKNARMLRYPRLLSPLVLQFTFGALLSASLIFYWFSGTLSVSWPLLIVVALLMVSNETFRHYYLNPIVQVGVLYFVLFSFLTLVLPFLFNSISIWVFLLSGVGGLFLVYVYVELLSIKLERFSRRRVLMAYLVVAIFLFMNLLYVANIIPPIPLSLRDAGVYHDVARVGGSYFVLAEEESWIDRLLPGQTVHVAPGERVFVFVSIFAPADLDTTIVHKWEYRDPEIGKWLEEGSFSYNIAGGRQDGYRGYSLKGNTAPGAWRVSVQTPRGQVLGSIKFTVEAVDSVVDLVDLTK